MPNAAHELNFILNAASTGIVSGDVAIKGGTDEQYVTLSFRQTASCSGDTETIELASIHVANNAPYEVALSEGSYEVVAPTYSQTTQIQHIHVTANAETTLNIVF